MWCKQAKLLTIALGRRNHLSNSWWDDLKERRHQWTKPREQVERAFRKTRSIRSKVFVEKHGTFSLLVRKKLFQIVIKSKEKCKQGDTVAVSQISGSMCRGICFFLYRTYGSFYKKWTPLQNKEILIFLKSTIKSVPRTHKWKIALFFGTCLSKTIVAKLINKTQINLSTKQN